MKVLVTGGAGFIGSNFVTRSMQTRSNLEITVLDSLTYAGNLENLSEVKDSIQIAIGDIRDSEQVNRLVAEVDLVVHFAAESHNDNSLLGPDLFFETNLMGTLNIANACRNYGVRLHHVSTDEVFGDLSIESTLEFNLESPYRPSSPYSASKAASDHLVRAWVRSFDLRATISNCSNNYGPRQHSEKLIPATIKRIVSGFAPILYGTGENIRDWIHVDDHTDGIWAILDRGAMGSTYLLGARNRVSNLVLVKGMLDYAGKDSGFLELVPDRPGHDKKYAIDPTSSLSLGWEPKHKNVMEELPGLFEYYATTF